MELSSYRLTKWSRLVRVRDVGFCVMCGGIFSVWRLNAHHIYPKALYPELAYKLWNGVSLCTGCHLGTVHLGNSFKDSRDDGHWRFFVPSFKRYTGLSAQRHFATANQARV